MEATIQGKKILRVYSGKPGCGCGCNGAYYTEGPMLKRVSNIIRGNPEMKVQGVTGEGLIFSLENDKRYYWAYTYKD